MRKRLSSFLVVLLVASGFAHAAKPINNLENQAVPVRPDGAAHSIEYIKSSIIKACAARGWQPVVEGENEISATINVRGKHYAKIRIQFSSTEYSIFYVESDNLDYNAKKQKIHKNYNNWVIKLSGTINKEISSNVSTAVVPASERQDQTAGNGDGPDVYEEILRLSELRDKGLLTDAEFEAEKRKLLERN